MELQIAEDGKPARFQCQPLSDPSCAKVVVHLDG
jgi:hypothetical protein